MWLSISLAGGSPNVDRLPLQDPKAYEYLDQTIEALEQELERCETGESPPERCVAKVEPLVKRLRALSQYVREVSAVAFLHRRAKKRLFEAHFKLGQTGPARRVLREQVFVSKFDSHELVEMEPDAAAFVRSEQRKIPKLPRSSIKIRCTRPCDVSLNETIVDTTGKYPFGRYRLTVRGHSSKDLALRQTIELDYWLRKFKLVYPPKPQATSTADLARSKPRPDPNAIRLVQDQDETLPLIIGVLSQSAGIAVLMTSKQAQNVDPLEVWGTRAVGITALSFGLSVTAMGVYRLVKRVRRKKAIMRISPG